jgi:hypothetical protein
LKTAIKTYCATALTQLQKIKRLWAGDKEMKLIKQVTKETYSAKLFHNQETGVYMLVEATDYSFETYTYTGRHEAHKAFKQFVKEHSTLRAAIYA